jgi:hypothetical protein
MVTFLLKDDDGKELINAPVPGPGGEVRFGVGSPTGPRSGTFRLWAPKNKSDVYVASRPLAGVQQLSLHESGECLFQYTRPEVAERWEPGRGRRIDKWRRPPETIDGWTRSFMVWVPESEVTPVPAGHEETKDIVWVPKPEPGEVIGFQVVIAQPRPHMVKLEGTTPLYACTLSNGEVCMLLATWQPLMFSSTTVILFVEDPENANPEVIYAVNVRNTVIGEVIGEYRLPGETNEPSDEIVAAAEEVELNPDLTIRGQRYLLVNIYRPVGTTSDGFVTLFGVQQEGTGGTLLGRDKRRLELFIYRSRAQEQTGG